MTTIEGSNDDTVLPAVDHERANRRPRILLAAPRRPLVERKIAPSGGELGEITPPANAADADGPHNQAPGPPEPKPVAMICLAVGALLLAALGWRLGSVDEDSLSSADVPTAQIGGSDQTEQDGGISAPESGASSPTTIVVANQGDDGTPPVEESAPEGPSQQADTRVESFREILAEAELNSDSLTADDIISLAEPVCIVAAAEDRDGYEWFRRQMASERAAESVLTIDELAAAVDAIVVAFCPVDGQRLGLVT